MFIAIQFHLILYFFVPTRVMIAYHNYFINSAPSCSLFLQSLIPFLVLGKSVTTEYGWFNFQYLLHEEEPENETRKKGEQSNHLLLPRKVVQVFHVHFQLMILAIRTHQVFSQCSYSRKGGCSLNHGF